MIVHLKGGLGNQLFQLAFAHYLYEKSGKRVRIFLPRVYRSSHDVKEFLEGCSHLREVSAIASFFLGLIFRVKWLSFFSHRLGILVFEDDKTVDLFEEVSPKLSRLYSPQIVSGFWQDWKVAVTSDQLFTSELHEFLDTHKDMPSETGVSSEIVVHIRRGDLLLEHNRPVYGVVPLSSYRTLLNHLKHEYPNASVITVSDSPREVVHEGARDEFGIILGPDACDPWQVLKLMRKATAVISANSTLSWWGAFMAAELGADVYVPTPWYANFSRESSDKKMYPKFHLYDAKYEEEGPK